MEIHFGWGSRQVKFVPGDGNKIAHIAWRHEERGGYDDSSTGVTYCWWDEPASVPALIARLQEIYAEYELWLTKELVRYKAEGSPMSDEQLARIEKARAEGMI